MTCASCVSRVSAGEGAGCHARVGQSRDRARHRRCRGERFRRAAGEHREAGRLRRDADGNGGRRRRVRAFVACRARQHRTRHRRDDVRVLRIACRKALAKVPGVTRASVNLATERATVDAAPDVTAVQLAEAVKQAGYGATPVAGAAIPPAASADLELDIGGMTCASCAGRVKGAGRRAERRARFRQPRNRACVGARRRRARRRHADRGRHHGRLPRVALRRIISRRHRRG